MWSSFHLLHCCFCCLCCSAADIWSRFSRESRKIPLPHRFFILLLSPAPQNPLMMFLPSLSPLTTFCDKSYSCSQHGKFAVILNNHLLSPQSATSPLISLFFGCLFWLALSHGAIRKSCFTSHASAMLIQKTGLQPKRCYFFHSLSFLNFFFSQKKFYVTKCCVRRRTAGSTLELMDFISSLSQMHYGTLGKVSTIPIFLFGSMWELLKSPQYIHSHTCVTRTKL